MKLSKIHLHIEKSRRDVRGKILFLSYSNLKFNLVEIKKGFARGGHYHPYPQIHTILVGRIQYEEENTISKKKKMRIVDGPRILRIPPNTAHMFTALTDTVFVELYEGKYEATNYPKYRKIVERKMAKGKKFGRRR